MPFFRLILLLLFAAFSTHAQEQSIAAEPRELPPEIAAKFDARLDRIGAQKKAVARLALQLEDTDGIIADVLGLRMDSVWTQMFDDTVTLARDVVAERDYVIDVLEDSAANRSVFLQVALEDVAVLRAAAAALPGDASVASQAAALEARIKIASRALQQRGRISCFSLSLSLRFCSCLLVSRALYSDWSTGV